VTKINRITTREEWLHTVGARLAPIIAEVAGLEEFPKWRAAIGFPSTGRKGKRIGECWYKDASGDATAEIFIRIDQRDEMEVAGILAHELIHAALGPGYGHGKEFRKIALGIGLTGKMTATTPGKDFIEAATPILELAGPMPGAALALGGPGTRKKDTIRQLKCKCPDCGYIVRTSSKWIEVAMPVCPDPECSNAGSAMVRG